SCKFHAGASGGRVARATRTHQCRGPDAYGNTQSRSCSLTQVAVARTKKTAGRNAKPHPISAGIKRKSLLIFAAFCGALLAATSLAAAAEVTPQRLLDPEPSNWLMNHRTYDGQRFSPLAQITKDNVRSLRLAFAVPLGGGAGNEWLEATPLVEDGFL